MNTLQFRPLDDAARSGRSFLLRAGDDLALGKWDGQKFVYPATRGVVVDFEPTTYYDPDWRSAGAFHA